MRELNGESAEGETTQNVEEESRGTSTIDPTCQYLDETAVGKDLVSLLSCYAEWQKECLDLGENFARFYVGIDEVQKRRCVFFRVYRNHLIECFVYPVPCLHPSDVPIVPCPTKLTKPEHVGQPGRGSI